MHRALRVACAAAALAANACTLNPVDGQSIANTSTSISFAGLSNTANQQVRVEVISGGSTPLVIGSTATAPTVTINDSGTDLFAWSLNATIPSSRWVAGTTGSFARIHTRFVGAALDGSDSFGYTFRPDWSSCHAANPNLGNFLTRCKSPRSPDAFIYTSDFPAGVDLIIRDMLPPPSPGARIPVIVRNNGRPGVVGHVTCSGGFSIDSLTVNVTLNPGEETEVDSFIPTTGTTSVTCTVDGTSEGGGAEANTTNNSRVETL